MFRKIGIVGLMILMGLMASCSQSEPSQLSFQGKAFKRVNSRESAGGKFDIVRYINATENLILIVPHADTDLDKFAKLYTQTFIAQGFRFDDEGSRHIGVRSSNVVYLTVAGHLKALAILLVGNDSDTPKTLSTSSDIFDGLEALQ